MNIVLSPSLAKRVVFRITSASSNLSLEPVAITPTSSVRSAITPDAAPAPSSIVTIIFSASRNLSSLSNAAT